jgi:Na+-transporting methylmalonyl-CoA/oxaloacetate decarboxylase gamma subunit
VKNDMNDLMLSLEITVLGMGLVFGAIILLWGMMAILTAVTADKEPESDSLEVDSVDPGLTLTPSPSPSGRGELERAALLAVAMALAEQGQSSAHPLGEPPTALVSAWQLGMRTRQMSEKGTMKRR